MANNSESINDFECLKCESLFQTKKKECLEGMNCPYCKGPLYPVAIKIESEKNNKGLSISVDIDVSEALTGLKAVQREAKKAARALREVEGLKSFNPVINITMNSTDDPKKFAKALNIEIEKLSKEW